MSDEVETGGEGETQGVPRPCGSSRKTLLGKGSVMALVTLEKETYVLVWMQNVW